MGEVNCEKNLVVHFAPLFIYDCCICVGMFEECAHPRFVGTIYVPHNQISSDTMAQQPVHIQHIVYENASGTGRRTRGKMEPWDNTSRSSTFQIGFHYHRPVVFEILEVLKAALKQP